jgi:DNA polymerase-3 subunit alpha
VSGKVQNDEFSGGLRVMAEDLLDLAALRARYASLLRLSMNGQADATRLQQMLAPYRASGDGGCRVLVQYENNKAVCEVALGDAWRVRPDNELLADLAAWLTADNVQLVYSA